MKYMIYSANRIVELDDRIVNAYLKTVDPAVLTESPFILAMMFDFGHFPNESEISNSELSDYCNNVLLQELEMAFERLSF